jgi:hypothetical protein
VGILAQGPEWHCGNLVKHDKHASVGEFVPTGKDGSRVQVGQKWCDGNPPLEPFVELTVRVPLDHWREKVWGHEEALRFLGLYGLGLFSDAMGQEGVSMVMRVRTPDKDHVYPVLKRKGSAGVSVILDAPQEVFGGAPEVG